MTTPADLLASNNLLTVISRFAMITATAALPIVGWLLQRGISSVDDVSKKVDTVNERLIETGGNVKLIQQAQSMQGAIIVDHEARLRAQEARPRQQ